MTDRLLQSQQQQSTLTISSFDDKLSKWEEQLKEYLKFFYSNLSRMSRTQSKVEIQERLSKIMSKINELTSQIRREKELLTSSVSSSAQERGLVRIKMMKLVPLLDMSSRAVCHFESVV